jgi:hypothetical protein
VRQQVRQMDVRPDGAFRVKLKRVAQRLARLFAASEFEVGDA